MRGNARGFSGIDTNRQIRTILMGGLSAQSASKWGLREVGVCVYGPEACHTVCRSGICGGIQGV